MKMRRLRMMQSYKPKVLGLAIIALLVTLALPLTSYAQGRGRGHDRNGHSEWNSKKCGKFVNCHDARNGRWDGRGPSRSRWNRWAQGNNWRRRGDWRYSRNNSARYQRNGYVR